MSENKKYWINEFNLVKQKNGRLGVDWASEIGKILEFYYYGTTGKIKLTGFNTNTHWVTFVYKGKEFEMQSCHFKECKLGRVVGTKTPEYRYSVGQIVNENNLILEQGRTLDGKNDKAYIVKCLNDGYVSDKPIREDSLMKGRKCPVCDNQIIIKGINDVATTHPHLVKYFVDIKDAYENSYSVRKKVALKCPDCGLVKMVAMYSFTCVGRLSCDRCGDGVSYPEKVMFSILEQLGMEFKPEYSPKWANGRRYDFYIPSKKLIIEMDGGLGHGNGNNMTNISPEESLLIDKEKDSLAKINGNEVIRIDCLKSDIEYIKNSIINSELATYFTLEMIDWDEANNDALCSRIKKACELWNSGVKNTIQIANLMNIGRTTACIYLKKGSFANLCDYTPDKSRAYSYKLNRNGKRVKLIKNGEVLKIYDSCADVERKSIDDVGMFLNRNNVAAVANGGRRIYKGYVFEYE